MSHTFLHEAAHAVMAIDRDIPFERIAVGTPEYFDATHPDGEVAGGLYVTPPVTTIVQRDPLGALEMVLAGKVAEDGALGHHLEGSWLGDLRLWFIGSELEERTFAAIADMVGKPVAEVERDVWGHLSEQFSRVRAVMEALAGTAVTSTPQLLSYDDGPWSMTYDQVVAVLS